MSHGKLPYFELVRTRFIKLWDVKSKKIEKFVSEDFCLTYGDGLSSVDIKKLINFHKRNKKLASVTAVKPAGRFGAIELKKILLQIFKNQLGTVDG